MLSMSVFFYFRGRLTQGTSVSWSVPRRIVPLLIGKVDLRCPFLVHETPLDPESGGGSDCFLVGVGTFTGRSKFSFGPKDLGNPSLIYNKGGRGVTRTSS